MAATGAVVVGVLVQEPARVTPAAWLPSTLERNPPFYPWRPGSPLCSLEGLKHVSLPAWSSLAWLGLAALAAALAATLTTTGSIDGESSLPPSVDAAPAVLVALAPNSDEQISRVAASREADAYRAALGDTYGRNKMDVDDLRAWKRIGWRDPLPTARDLAEAAGLELSDAMLAELRELLERHEAAISPVRDEFTRGLSRVVGVKVERGEFTPVDTSQGLEPDEYDGGWALWTTRNGIGPDGGQGTASVHVYPGEDAQLDTTWDDLQAHFDAFFWEANDTLKDYE